jgi:hypothetical protein
MKSWIPHLVISLGCILGSSQAVLGADVETTNSDSYWNSLPFYHSQEVSLDLFGTASVSQPALDHLTGDRFYRHVRLGAGAGVNYFFTRYFGIGADAYSESTAHSFVDAVAGSLIGRLPIGDTGLAPYGFAGGGRQFDDILQWEGHIGAGLEYRFMRHFSAFVDARYVFAEHSRDYGLGRAGLRFSF